MLKKLTSNALKAEAVLGLGRGGHGLPTRSTGLPTENCGQP